MAEFDEKAYKEEQKYDEKYDTYMFGMETYIENHTSLGNVSYKGETINIITEDFYTITDDRATNRKPRATWNAAGNSFLLTSMTKEERNEFGAAMGRLSGCADSVPELLAPVLEIWDHILQEASEESEFTNDEGENVDAQTEDANQNDNPEKNVSVDLPDKEDEAASAVTNTIANNLYMSWDPRLTRLDSFLFDGEDGAPGVSGIRIPFASHTAATAFTDHTWNLEKGMIEAQIAVGNIDLNYGIYKYLHNSRFNNLFKDLKNKEKFAADLKSLYESTDNNSKLMSPSDMAISATTKLPVSETESFTTDGKYYGVQSIVHPYSLTKLVGGIGKTGEDINNYMYDIRDTRRFYGLSVNSGDVLAVSNPTITLLIEWSNKDIWGRTPYSYQDFVFCRYYGDIQNNRLITLRRYAAPTYDNLQWESMFGKQTDGNTNPTDNVKNNEDTKVLPFSPHATVVTWFGGNTGNELSSLMNFTTGINWDDVAAKVHEPSGSEGESPQLVVDKLLGDVSHTNLFGGAEFEPINKFLLRGSAMAADITSFGKFALGLKNGIDPAGGKQLYDHLTAANSDPYDSLYSNRILGPVNRISSVKKRKEGIEFSQTLTITCEYRQKAIGGINPKAALLDVLGNCMEMVSPHAVFWGGGYRFMIKPLIYPFYDGGWRDSFMEKIYQGKILGSNGALATVYNGIKSVGLDENNNWSFDNIKSMLGSAASSAFAVLGTAISSLSDMFGGSDILNTLSDKAFGAGGAQTEEEKAALKAKGQNAINNMLGSLENMLHNRMLLETTLPSVTGMGNVLIGEPTGEWHLTIGNPLNPIMVIGNLICKNMQVTWENELGPDDFPIGFKVVYTLEHAMARDYDAIQSMFNRGMGKYYVLPDYMNTSSDTETYVDKYTNPAFINSKEGQALEHGFVTSSRLLKEVLSVAGNSGKGLYKTTNFNAGTKTAGYGANTLNPDINVITKFTPLPSAASKNIGDLRAGIGGTVPMLKSIAATRKKYK